MTYSTGSALPGAQVSRTALSAGAVAAVSAGGRIADLRRDAWGHGLIPVAQAVRGAGVDSAVVDSEDEIDLLRGTGIIGMVDAEPDLDSTLLFGLPGPDGVCRTRPAMRLRGRILSLKPLRAGEGVSYGYAHRADQDTTIALVTGGYAQGIVRSLGNRVSVEVAGTMRPIIGRVAMDVCVIDVGDVQLDCGAPVTFFGGTGPASDALVSWAWASGLAPAELVTVVGLKSRRDLEP